MGEGAGKPPPPAPSTPMVGTKGETTEATLGGTAASNQAGLGRGEGYPKASPLRARHARPPFPLGPLPEQLSSERPKALGPAEPLETQLRSPRARHGSCAGAGDAGHVAGLQPPPHALTAPPTPSGRSARTPAPQGGRGDLGRAAEAGRSAGRSVAEPAHLGRQLLAPVDPRARQGFDPRHNPA